MGNILPKSVAPPLTERNLDDQFNKVYLITGGTSGIGRELTKILYAANAKVYFTARSKSKGERTISSIQSECPHSKGYLSMLIVDYNDLATVKPAVTRFLTKENRLDVLFNNAGIMIPPQGTQTTQGYEAQLGVNNLAPFLITKLLIPLLTKSAADNSESAVRIVWVSSSAVKAFAPPTGVEIDNLDYHNDKGQWFKYGSSKAGNVFHAAEFGKRFYNRGVASVVCDPGNLDTNLYKDMPHYQHRIARAIALKPAIYGAYTELYCGLSKDLQLADGWAWVEPWGRVGALRPSVEKECGLGGVAERFWDWCDAQIEDFL